MTSDERKNTIQRVKDYYVSQNDDFIALTDDISNNVNTYKALRNDMNEVDDNNFTATVDFENNNKNVVQNAGKYDGSSNLVGIADDGGNINYDPKKHIVEIASPVYKNDTYDHIYIENDVLYAKGLDANTIDNDDSISITLNIYPKKTERNYLYSGNEHPIRDDRYNMSKALNNDTELLIQQNKQIGMLGLITTGILGVGLYVLSRK
jgi:hypothetical protein